MTAYYKELQVFPELMDIHHIDNVIYQDILDQLREYILLDSLH